MPLTPISQGDEVLSKPLQDNFEYLDEKITDVSSGIANMQASVQSTIGSALSIYQDVVKPKSSFASDATDVTSGDCYISANTVVAFTPTGNVTFKLPPIEDNTKFYQILVQIEISGSKTITLGTDYFFDFIKPVFTAGTYDIIYEYDNINSHWVCGATKKGEVS